MGKLINLNQNGVDEVIKDVVKDAKLLEKKRSIIVAWMDEDGGTNISFMAGGSNSDIWWTISGLYQKIESDFFNV